MQVGALLSGLLPAPDDDVICRFCIDDVACHVRRPQGPRLQGAPSPAAHLAGARAWLHKAAAVEAPAERRDNSETVTAIGAGIIGRAW